MKKLASLLLCLSLGLFTLARATKSADTATTGGKTAHKKPTAQRADAEYLLNRAGKTLAEEDTDEEVTPADDDSTEDASADEDEHMSEDDGSDASVEDPADDDGADADGSGDNAGGDEGD